MTNILNRIPQIIHNEIKRVTLTQLNRQKQNRKTYDYYISIYDADTMNAEYD